MYYIPILVLRVKFSLLDRHRVIFESESISSTWSCRAIVSRQLHKWTLHMLLVWGIDIVLIFKNSCEKALAWRARQQHEDAFDIDRLDSPCSERGGWFIPRYSRFNSAHPEFSSLQRRDKLVEFVLVKLTAKQIVPT